MQKIFYDDRCLGEWIKDNERVAYETSFKAAQEMLEKKAAREAIFSDGWIFRNNRPVSCAEGVRHGRITQAGTPTCSSASASADRTLAQKRQSSSCRRRLRTCASRA